MGAKTGKLVLMADCDRDRRDLEEGRLTGMQLVARARRDDNVRKIKEMLREPSPRDDPQTWEAGIARARQAVEEAAGRRRLDG